MRAKKQDRGGKTVQRQGACARMGCGFWWDGVGKPAGLACLAGNTWDILSYGGPAHT